MNNTYYREIPNNTFYNENTHYQNQNPYNYNLNQSNIYNILNYNKGKKIIIYQTYKNSENKNFKGILEYSNKEYIIISDPGNGNWYLLLNKNTNYIEFNEQINTIDFYNNR